VFAAIALEHYWIAAACLLVTLLVREDAGFHAVGTYISARDGQLVPWPSVVVSNGRS